MQPEPTPPASAGPRVSDEELAKWCAFYHGQIAHDPDYANDDEVMLAFDLADCRTALAAANARIAVLEAVAEAADKVATANLRWDEAEGDDIPRAEVPFQYAMRELESALAALATASPEPGAAHE